MSGRPVNACGAMEGLGWRRARRGLLLAVLMGLSACAAAGPNGATTEGASPAAQPAESTAQKPARKKPPAAKAEGGRPGAGLLSPVATAGYVPLKAIPCAIGIVGSAVGFLFTFDAQMVKDTFTLNCGGDWVMTPGMLEGREPFRPVGRVEEAKGPAAPPPPAPTGAVPPFREPGTE